MGIKAKEEKNFDSIKFYLINIFQQIGKYGHPGNFRTVLKVILENSEYGLPVEICNYISTQSLELLPRNVLLEICELLNSYLCNIRKRAEETQRNLYTIFAPYMSDYIRFASKIIKHHEIYSNSSTYLQAEPITWTGTVE